MFKRMLAENDAT